MAAGAILSKIKNKVPYRSEVNINAIESDIRTSKMAADGNFVNNLKNIKRSDIDMKCPEMWSKVNFGHLKSRIYL